jgi:cell wall-associated NlpC family hydrolase
MIRSIPSAASQVARQAPTTPRPASKPFSDNPELNRLMKDVEVGDIVLVCYNSPGEPVAELTQGPFSHALIYVGNGMFIEAIGLTGAADDPTNHRVRRIAAKDVLNEWHSYRVIRPGDERAAAAAVAYAEAQVGKPYDYTFGEERAGRAYYCSSLVYMAYAAGAGVVPKLSKSAERDVLLTVLDAVLDAVEPEDRLFVTDAVSRYMATHPTPEQLAAFIVDKILPRCAATRDLVQTPEQREATLKIARDGVFPRAARQTNFFARMAMGVVDLWHAAVDTGLLSGRGLTLAWKLARGLYPFAEAAARRVLGGDSWLTLLVAVLPGTRANTLDPRFVSPTDLGWADVSHRDYNVKPGIDLDLPLRR